ncbi:MAG: nickel pincer cofactor biosynthesis protein LarC [Spirulinaceae cyanobacterium]
MIKIAYLECPTGIAGDMCLGALVDVGVPLPYLTEQLEGLGIKEEYQLKAEKVKHNGQIGTKVQVNLCPESSSNHHHHPPARHLPEIEKMIHQANLPSRVTAWSLRVFRQLAEAEGAVHGTSPEKVHFHEVGATDALIDIIGTCLGLDWLGIEHLYCSALPTGGGTVKAAHGLLPVPVPAVLKLWETRQVPIYSNGINKELVTPTGAAIAVALATDFGSPPMMELVKVGLGAGTAQLPLPNLLRLWLGNVAQSPKTDIISVLETQIDDLNPQVIGYVFEELFKVGAVDVFSQGIGMKKSRPGILLTVICHPEKVAVCEAVLFKETTTLGIRHRTQARSILSREIQEVKTAYGVVRVKVASQEVNGAKKIFNIQPEYEDCAQLARMNNQTWLTIHQMALDAWYSK